MAQPFEKHHQGLNYLLSKVHKLYRKINLRSSLTHIKLRFVQKLSCGKTESIMAEIPKESLVHQHPPFNKSKVDYYKTNVFLIVGIPRSVVYFCSFVQLLVLYMFKFFLSRTLVPGEWDCIGSSPAVILLLWFD